MAMRMTVTARTVSPLAIVSGIITTKFWTCWRSVLARLISCPVWHGVVEGEVQPLDVGEQPVAERRLDPAGLSERQVPANAGEHGGDHAGRGDGERPQDQRAQFVGLDSTVDGLLHEEPDAHLGQRPDQPDEHRQRDLGAARAHGVEHEAPTGAGVHGVIVDGYPSES